MEVSVSPRLAALQPKKHVTLTVATAAVLAAALLGSPSALAGKAANDCRAKSEKAGCPLPAGAIYSGTSSPGSVKVPFDRYGGVYIEAKLIGPACDQSAGPPPPYLIGYGGFRKKTVKVGASVNFPPTKA